MQIFLVLGINSQYCNAPVTLGIEGGGLEERHPDHGDGGSDGEGSDPAQHEANNPREAEHNLDQRGHTDGALYLPHPDLPDLQPVTHVISVQGGDTPSAHFSSELKVALPSIRPAGHWKSGRLRMAIVGTRKENVPPWMMGRRHPNVDCSKVMRPDTKRMVEMM